MFDAFSLGKWLNSAKSLPRFSKTPNTTFLLSLTLIRGKAIERLVCAIDFSFPQKNNAINAITRQIVRVNFRGSKPRDLIRRNAARYSSLIRKLGLEPVTVLGMGQTPKNPVGLKCESGEWLVPDWERRAKNIVAAGRPNSWEQKCLPKLTLHNKESQTSP